jgi:two-component system CheB/CheR fusion protein
VVGIGASAGGLDAFKKFFGAMPPDSGIAFVLVPHLDPDHKSLMVDLLVRHTTMPVVEAENDMRVEANRVYIIPPNKYMTIHGGVLRLTGPVQRYSAQTSIDLFLRSLADDQQKQSICIILSGTGSHGTLGMKAVKAAGGLAMVQDPVTAEYERMPQSAIATGLADYVLPAEGMPEALIKHVKHTHGNGGAHVEPAPGVADHLSEVLALLRARAQVDFRAYRKNMLMRRIERRMRLNSIGSIPDYLAFLHEHPEELKQLAKDLFVGLTSFFLDADAFGELASQVIAPLVQSKQADAVIRVWVPGCATGEEAYSIAMLLQEQLSAANKSCRVQIFATDVDEDAVAAARQGLYPDSISADVSPERLSRFFTRVNDRTYEVSKQVRERVIFAVQNLIGDAPLTRIDLICCRNLLTFLEPEVQKKVLRLFHYALNEGGCLFMGSSDTIDPPIDLFETLSKKGRIYRRIGSTRLERVDFPIIAPVEVGRPARHSAELAELQPVNLGEFTQRLLLDQFAPAAVLINRKCEILYFFGACAQYLEFPSGQPTRDLILMAREGLRTWLRRAVHRAIRDNESVVLAHVQGKRNGSYRPARVTVTPVQAPKAAEGLLLITFEDQPAADQPPSPPGVEGQAEGSDESALRQLEDELKATREDLQTTVEELESSNEELKASNEEATSMNEELQSANEELETSREKLQALNEKLSTVISQLQAKVEELEKTNNDMANFLHSTVLPTVFLDGASRIRLFTPNATGLFHLIATDVGRPLGDIRARFDDPELLGDVQQVLKEFIPREKEVSTADGSWWIRRIMPYRTRDHRIDGIVITFVDITERILRESEKRFRLMADASPVMIWMSGTDKLCTWFNKSWLDFVGRPMEQELGNGWAENIHTDDSQRCLETYNAAFDAREPFSMEYRLRRHDGEYRWLLDNGTPLYGAGEVFTGYIGSCIDITERKCAEQSLIASEERLQAILNTAADAIITIDYQGIIQSVNSATERMFGYSAAEMIGQNVTMLMASPHREWHDAHIARYLQTGEKHILGISREIEARRKDGSVFPTELAVSEIKHLKLFTGIHRDLTERKQLEREVVEVASLEQRRIGEDLHDSVAQELTALNLLASDLAETLRTDPAKASPLVERMEQGLQRSQQGLRVVLRGLLPVAVDSEGLMAALADLAGRTQQEGKVHCVFDCPEPVTVADNLTATHLYLIAQEAVYNAVKHSGARVVRITLRENGELVLSVQDDGIGMPAQPVENLGLGLRIMHNRAAIIGAMLTIEPVRPRGTVITCVQARKSHAPRQDEEAGPGSHRR